MDSSKLSSPSSPPPCSSNDNNKKKKKEDSEEEEETNKTRFNLQTIKSKTDKLIKSSSSKTNWKERRSIITDTTISSRKKAIISIAIRKGLLVFFSVHGVISASFTALALVRSTKRGKKSSPTSRNSVWKRIIEILLENFRSPSTARLASWLGLYSTLWTFTYSFLRKFQHKFSRWNAFIAGSLCGVSFFAQSKQDRKELAPNVLCRALYSLLMCYPLFHLKHGDILLFALSNAQIAIGYLLYPSTLPSWYVNWISRVGGLNPRFVELNRQMARSIISSSSSDAMKSNIIKQHHRLIFKDTLPRTWKNESRVKNWLDSSNPSLRKCAPCALNHHGQDSCRISNLQLFLRTMLKMSPTYAVLHLVPALIFRSKFLLNSPIKFIKTIIKRTISSGLFLSTFCSVVQNCFCIPSKLYEDYELVLPVVPVYGLLGFTTGISLLWEEPKRRGELALYCAPKALYSLWAVLKAKKIIPTIIFGDILVCSFASGILMDCFVHRKHLLPPLTRGIIDQLVDPHTPSPSPSPGSKK